MSSFITKRSRSRSVLLWQSYGIKIRSIISSCNCPSDTDSSGSVLASVLTRSFKTATAPSSFGFKSGEISYLNQKFGKFAYSWSNFVSSTRSLSSEAVAVASTCDGLTVERIIANQWTILDENESDWKSHAAAIAQSIQVIKKRLQWKKLLVRVKMLSGELNKPDLWNDPNHAGKISREHGSLMGKMKGVMTFERELLEHIDMLKLAKEENDSELESVGVLHSFLKI